MRTHSDEAVNLVARIDRTITMPHLIRRFFGHIRARSLTESEAETVRKCLSDAMAKLFFTMVPADQRHAFDVYQRSGSESTTSTAALMHDIGKTVAPAGAFARSLATAASAVGMPLRGSWAKYRDHGEIGAKMLEEVGADSFAVAFTRGHPGKPPVGVSIEAWERLAAADDV
ncbi:MAG: HD domain-containing protein [Actinomycetota bacterium]|nr:HD domain-containing protein [Actinomycetota bacterium]